MVYVFKTSVKTQRDVYRLQPKLNALDLFDWNFDLEDCDCILRVETHQNPVKGIASLLCDYGFSCTELQ